MDIHGLDRLPKVEIHLHLEGSVEPSDLQALARRNHLPDELWSLNAFEEKYRYADFAGFLGSFKFITEHLITPADYGWIATQLIDRLHHMQVLYAEIFVSAGVVLKQKKDLDAVVDAITTASREREEQTGIRVNWILDVTRQFGVEFAERVAEAAVRYRESGLDNIVGVGMGGDENSFPAHEFKHVFDEARRHGLHVTIHAGEVAGPQSIWEAIEVLGAERIGHGIAARLDERLMNHLKARSLPLECAPTSNLCTGVIQRIEDHPLKMFYEHGLRVTLNTDDPALFHTDLLREYRQAATHFQLTPRDFAQFNRNAIEGCFAGPSEKMEVLRLFEERLRGLENAQEVNGG
ncbi:MAG: adenosine deaminase [Acidobacteriia bacterium]|nr:adenosine deaminase [Terriglobia bacterium]